jgi:hypothetical protein
MPVYGQTAAVWNNSQTAALQITTHSKSLLAVCQTCGSSNIALATTAANEPSSDVSGSFDELRNVDVTCVEEGEPTLIGPSKAYQVAAKSNPTITVINHLAPEFYI